MRVPVKKTRSFLKIVLSLIIISNCLIYSNSSVGQVLLIGDCDYAQELRASFTTNFKRGPLGYGDVLEIKGNSATSKYFFQKEEHTAWFKFKTLTNGYLTFIIAPKDTSADYDFLLFKYTDDSFCGQVQKRRIKPVRSNISRYNPEELSITGLSVLAEEPFVSAGPYDYMSRAIQVEKDEEFILVINNVYGNTAGFSIHFNYYEEHEVSGQVIDEESNEIIGGAEISWEDLKMGELARTKSDEVTGEYNFRVPVLKTKIPRPYNLAVTKDHHMIIEKTVEVKVSDEKVRSIDIIMPKLKKGIRSDLHSINFFGDSPKTLPSAQKGLKRILKLMEGNPNLKILIEGHTNGCQNGFGYAQKLSEARAKTVKLYLVNNGIEEDRIETVGLNCSKMLYPEMKTSTERQLNRRVEILVTDYDEKR